MSEPASGERAAGVPGSEFLPDDLPPADVASIVEDARFILNGVLYPNALPPDPLPAPLELALAIVSRRIYDSGTSGGGGPVVSESVGSYTYRRQPRDTLDTVALLGGDVRDLIDPWYGMKRVYDVFVGGDVEPLPVDAWQRNLEELAR